MRIPETHVETIELPQGRKSRAKLLSQSETVAQTVPPLKAAPVEVAPLGSEVQDLQRSRGEDGGNIHEIAAELTALRTPVEKLPKALREARETLDAASAAKFEAEEKIRKHLHFQTVLDDMREQREIDLADIAQAKADVAGQEADAASGYSRLDNWPELVRKNPRGWMNEAVREILVLERWADLLRKWLPGAEAKLKANAERMEQFKNEHGLE